MSLLTKLSGFVLAGVALTFGIAYGSKLLAQDPFVGYNEKSEDTNIGIKMKDVEMRVYDGKDLISQSDVGDISVLRDRQTYLLGNVEGYLGRGEQKVDFVSSKATYDAVARQLQFANGVNMRTKDLDLFTQNLVADEGAKSVVAKGPIAGKAYGGQMKTAYARYDQLKGALTTGPSVWKGGLPGVVQEGSPVQSDPKSPWQFESGITKTVSGITTFTGSLLATDGEIVLRSEKGGQYDKKKDVLTCEGKVYYFSQKVNLVADKVVVYRKERRAVLTGSVRMLVKRKDQPDITEEIPPFRPDVPEDVAANRPPAPTSEETQQAKDLDAALQSPENVREYPAIIVGERIEFWYAKGARRATIEGNPQCLQDFPGGRWRRAYADKAAWNGQSETVTLTSGATRVRMKTSIGDDVTAKSLVLDAKEGNEKIGDWEGVDIKGKFMADDDEETTPPATTGTTGTTGTSGTNGGTGTTGTTGTTGSSGG